MAELVLYSILTLWAAGALWFLVINPPKQMAMG